MRILDHKQGTDEWLAARVGLPTASRFSEIVTPKTTKPSSSQDAFIAYLTAEWFLGRPLDDFSSGFTERGTELEAEAAAWYAFQQDADAREVGLCLTDDGKVGASPDRLVNADGLLECKCPGAAKHMANYLDPEAFEADHWCQVQGQLWVTRREWVDLVSFNPKIPNVIVRVKPDPKFQAALSEHVPAFVAKLDAAKERLAADRAAYIETLRTVDPADDVFATMG